MSHDTKLSQMFADGKERNNQPRKESRLYKKVHNPWIRKEWGIEDDSWKNAEGSEKIPVEANYGEKRSTLTGNSDEIMTWWNNDYDWNYGLYSIIVQNIECWWDYSVGSNILIT